MRIFQGGMFVGLHQPSDAQHFARTCISVNRLRNRKSDFVVHDWIMDSGAFTEISTYGGYRFKAYQYAEEIRRWSKCGNMLAAVSQDFMCEPFIVDRTGLSVAEHQRLTIERYKGLLDERLPVYLMPVIQGYKPGEYAQHVLDYGDLLDSKAWAGVGSVCKRNSNVSAIEAVLGAINDVRPDLRLHGFGVKATALRSGVVRTLLWSADSMAWSYAARRQGRNANDWREAKAFRDRIDSQEIQLPLIT